MLIYRVVIEWTHNSYSCVPNTHSNEIPMFLYSYVLSLYSCLFLVFSSIPLFSIPSFQIGQIQQISFSLDKPHFY
jgi:hypothetical protein